MNTLTEALNHFWESIIKNIAVDILNSSISIELEIVENGESYKHTVIFKEVSSYFYLNNIGDSRLCIHQPEEDEYLELTTINYLEEGVGQIKVVSMNETWANQCFASANFVIEIWSRILFIEAKKVIIDRNEYSIEM